MSRVFADTSYFIALNSPTDIAYSKALGLSNVFGTEIVTTEYVLLEFANACSRGGHKRLFLEVLQTLRDEPGAMIVQGSHDLWVNGEQLYRRFADKDWSLVDCTSFVTMRRLRIAKALTSDRHFTQAGFRALLLDA